MKNRLLYIFSVGLAFYCGMKLTKPKIKTVVKTVVEKDTSLQIMFNACHRAQKECIEKYDTLVEEANKKVKDLESEVDACEDKYYIDTPKEYPQKNLEPEIVEEKQPEMEGYYDQ